MSRSGYSDDLDPLVFGRWRAVIRSATRGKRGQQFFRDLADALDAMPVKRLGAGEMVDEAHGCDCTLGALDRHRGGDPGNLDPYDYDSLGSEFNIASQLSQEIMYMNDEGAYRESPEERWTRMRAWVAKQIVAGPVAP